MSLSSSKLKPLFAGHAEFEIVEERLNKQCVIAQANRLAELNELTSFTFENNKIEDAESICKLFTNLKTFERIENLNFR